jgi:Right handed beta helix region
LIVNSTIAGNTASGGAGGIIFDNGNTLTILNSTISGNTAQDGAGGGLLIDEGLEAFIANSTFANNTATAGAGGRIALAEVSLTLIQTTISGNTAADSGDGLYIAGYAEPESRISQPGEDDGVGAQQAGEVTITGTIIAGNADGSDDIGSSDPHDVNADNSVLGGIDAVITVVDGGGNQLDVTDPGLGTLASNGGPTQTMALLDGRVAIDAGPDPLPSFPGNEFDQRGPGFDRVVGARVDVGAFEVQAPEPIVITPTFTG